MDEASSIARWTPALTIANVSRRSRLTTLFRLIVAIPWLVVEFLWLVVAALCAVVAWFALLFTARYPAGLYELVAGFCRYSTRYYAFTWLAADPFPPFDGAEHDEYPTVLRIGPPLPSYSRLKVLLRVIYIIPAYLVCIVAGIVLYVISFVSWIVIIVTGRQPDGLQNALRWCLSWQVRYTLLLLLVSETYDLQVA